MKKYFKLGLFISTFLQFSNVYSQLKLSEINPAAKALELYSPNPSTTNLDCYTILSYFEESIQGKSFKGYYVIDLPNVNVSNVTRNTTAQNYLICAPNTLASYELELFPASPATNVKKYSYNSIGDLTITDVTDRNTAIFDGAGASKPVVFLLKNSSIVDVFVSGFGLNLSSVQSKILNLPSVTIGSCEGQVSINPSSVTVSDFQVTFDNAGTGNSSYTWQPVTGACFTWNKVASTYNSGSNLTGVALWDDKFLQLTNSSTWDYISTSNTFPSTSSSFVRTGTSITSVKFQVEVADPLNFTIDNSTPQIEVYKDNGGGVKNNSIFNTGSSTALQNDQLISSSITRVGATSKFQIEFDYSLILDGSSDILYNIFVKMSVSGSPCFYTVTLLKFPLVSALPVSISNFNVNHANSINKIYWSTSSEQNNKGFEIQRSIGNTNDFKTIGFVGTRAKDGNSQTEISYSFEDADVKAGQTHYYRLNQIDFDGKSTFSPVRSVKPGSIESNLNVYPNPSQGSVTVNTGSASGKLNIYVLDNSGRVVNQYLNVSTSNTRISNLKKGFYTLKIVNTESGEQSAQRVVVQ